MLTTVLIRTADVLQRERIECEVLHMASIKPLDVDLVVVSVTQTGCAVVAENANVIAGLGSAVAEALGEAEPVSLKRVGYQDACVRSGPIAQILAKHSLRPVNIAERTRTVMKHRDGKAVKNVEALS